MTGGEVIDRICRYYPRICEPVHRAGDAHSPSLAPASNGWLMRDLL